MNASPFAGTILGKVIAFAARTIPATERDEHTMQSTEEAHDEGHTEGWNEALTELQNILNGVTK